MSCLRQKVNDRGKIRLIKGKAWFSYPADVVASCKVGDLFQWGPGPSAMDRRRTQICANKNGIEAISTIPPENINQIVLLEYFPSANDVHIKYFYRRQLPACLRSWTQFNFGDKPAVNAWDRLRFGDLCSPAYWATCIGRFVLFFFQSAESCRISHLENKNALIAG